MRNTFYSFEALFLFNNCVEVDISLLFCGGGKSLRMKLWYPEMKPQCRRELYREESTVVVRNKGQHRRNYQKAKKTSKNRMSLL